jgi:hypothetical protein
MGSPPSARHSPRYMAGTRKVHSNRSTARRRYQPGDHLRARTRPPLTAAADRLHSVRASRAKLSAHGIHGQRSAHSAQPRTPSHTRPPSVARPWTRLSSVAVRGNRRLHRPSWRPHAVRYTSVDTATSWSTATQGETRWDREETARTAAYPQLAGRFRRWWQVVDSNHRRRSRRFYSPLAPPESPPADQHLCVSRPDCGPPPSAMRPCAPDFWGRPAHGRGRKRPRTGRVGAVTLTVRPASRL